MGDEAGAEALAAGRTALDQGDWAAARAAFEEAAAATGSAAAWEGVGRSAWWLGDQDATFAARERAYRGYRAADDLRGAARAALWIASDHLDFRGDDAVAAAWLGRGRTLLADLPPGVELGFITLLEADIALLARQDLETATRSAREALAIARACGEVDVEVVALGILGSALVRSGAVEEGLQRLDDCATLAVAEQFTDQAAPGWALCHTVSACSDAGDLARAEQWCRELHRWSTTWHARHFFGICRTAYGGVLTTRGEWQLADDELSTAMNDLRQVRPALAAPTAVRLGELRARQGRRAEARTLLESALPFPDAVIALGALDLEEGDVTAAVQAAERVLRRLEVTSALDRFPAIELLARAHCAAGETARGRAALDQLQESGFTTPYLRARVCLIRAEVLACAASWDDARQAAEDAVDLFTGCSAPYEGARARLVLARALEGIGRGEHAETERRAADRALRSLGARVEEKPADTAGALSAREVDILRLVAQGLSDADVAERLFLSPHTVHRHMANLRTKLGTRSRAAAVARAAKLSLI